MSNPNSMLNARRYSRSEFPEGPFRDALPKLELEKIRCPIRKCSHNEAGRNNFLPHVKAHLKYVVCIICEKDLKNVRENQGQSRCKSDWRSHYKHCHENQYGILRSGDIAELAPQKMLYRLQEGDELQMKCDLYFDLGCKVPSLKELAEYDITIKRAQKRQQAQANNVTNNYPYDQTNQDALGHYNDQFDPSKHYGQVDYQSQQDHGGNPYAQMGNASGQIYGETPQAQFYYGNQFDQSGNQFNQNGTQYEQDRYQYTNIEHMSPYYQENPHPQVGYNHRQYYDDRGSRNGPPVPYDGRRP